MPFWDSLGTHSSLLSESTGLWEQQRLSDVGTQGFPLEVTHESVPCCLQALVVPA